MQKKTKEESQPKNLANDSPKDDFFMDDEPATERVVDEKQKASDLLELLMAGEDEEEQERDYDIRGIQRMEKNKEKKLRGSRKRKEENLASNVSGTDFNIDVKDNRFAAVLDGSDGRFGIDKTDPSYKETPGMRTILAEQTKNRKKNRRKAPFETVAPDVSAEAAGSSTGSAALSSLVQRLKSKVSKKSQ